MQNDLSAISADGDRRRRRRGALIAALLLSLGLLAVLDAIPAAHAAERDGGDNSLGVGAIDHVGINVPDADEAIALFKDLLGARVVLDARPAPVSAAWKETFSWHATSRIERLVMLQTSAGDRIELFEYSGPEVSARQPREDDAGATHIAFRVRDMTASLAVLRRRGLRVLNEPVTNPDGTRWFYFLTPWNSQLELVVPPNAK